MLLKSSPATPPSVDASVTESTAWKSSKNGRFVARAFSVSGSSRRVEVLDLQKRTEDAYDGQVTYSLEGGGDSAEIESKLATQNNDMLISSETDQAPFEFLRLDYGELVFLESLRLDGYAFVGSTYSRFSVEYSVDGVNWTKQTDLNNGGQHALNIVNFDVDVRMVRLVLESVNGTLGTAQLDHLSFTAKKIIVDPSLTTRVGDVINANTTYSSSYDSEFGVRVDVSDNGDTLVVTSKNDYYYIFELQNGTWTQTYASEFAYDNGYVTCGISEDGTKAVFWKLH